MSLGTIMNKTQKQIEMESPEFNSMVQLCHSWFQKSMRFTNRDEIYDRIYSHFRTLPDYKERKLWLRSSVFRLLCGNASLLGESQTVINELHTIKF